MLRFFKLDKASRLKSRYKYWLVFVYSFFFNLDNNFLICSFLQDFFSELENNIFIFYFLILNIQVHKLYCKYSIKKKRNIYFTKKYSNSILSVKYILLYLKKFNLVYLINVYLLKMFLLLKIIFTIYKSINIVNLFIFIINFIKSKLLIWYPIYKSYSIFGYYKSTRLKYIDIKNENLKRLKY